MPKKSKTATRQTSISQGTAFATMLGLCLVTVGMVVLAKSVSVTADLTSTSSGSTVSSSSGSSVRDAVETMEQQRQEEAWNQRQESAETFFVQMQSERSSLLSLRRFLEQNRIRQQEHRRTCAADLRAASKFTKLPITLRCYQADLQLEMERLRRQQEYAERMPGVQQDTRELARTRLQLLSDAMTAIVTGIDSNVFDSVETLQEGKTNLLQSYREPAWLLRTRMQAEQLSTWTDGLITRAAQAAASLDNPSEETEQKIVEGIQCLETGRQLLAAVRSAADFVAADEQLTSAVRHVDTCPALFRTAFSSHKTEQSTQQSSAPASRYLRPTQ